MTKNTIGVAISTTGDEHRLPFLETTVDQWRRIMPDGLLFVTVDGDRNDAAAVQATIDRLDVDVFRVGQPYDTNRLRDGRAGVATNKNTGLELLMDTSAGHIFLCDDDTRPLSTKALDLHTRMSKKVPHSMVCWGRSRKPRSHIHYGTWSWPRGVLLYQTRAVVEEVGGMIEEFGPGGHEHVEWSRRISQAGLTPASVVTPVAYVDRGRGAMQYWECEDMPRPGEPNTETGKRRKRITSVRRKGSDWRNIRDIMDRRDGDTTFVSYRASENGRMSATLFGDLSGRGAGGEK